MIDSKTIEKLRLAIAAAKSPSPFAVVPVSTRDLEAVLDEIDALNKLLVAHDDFIAEQITETSAPTKGWLRFNKAREEYRKGVK